MTFSEVSNKTLDKILIYIYIQSTQRMDWVRKYGEVFNQNPRKTAQLSAQSNTKN